MIYVFTGNGKGKTTSAIGQAMRVIGQGRRVAMFQFVKSKKWETGEEKTIKLLSKKFYFKKGGKGFVGILGDDLAFSEHKNAAQDLLESTKKAIDSKKFDLVIMDEINVALALGLITVGDVILLIKGIPQNVDLILTGRNAHPKIIKLADLVTEFKEVKHYFNSGIIGQKGREY